MKSGLIVYVKLFSAAGHFMKNPRSTVHLQDPILALDNIPKENSNLQGAYVLLIFYEPYYWSNIQQKTVNYVYEHLL